MGTGFRLRRSKRTFTHRMSKRHSWPNAIIAFNFSSVAQSDIKVYRCWAHQEKTALFEVVALGALLNSTSGHFDAAHRTPSTTSKINARPSGVRPWLFRRPTRFADPYALARTFAKFGAVQNPDDSESIVPDPRKFVASRFQLPVTNSPLYRCTQDESDFHWFGALTMGWNSSD